MAGRTNMKDKKLEEAIDYVFPLMEVEPTICIELKNEEDEG